LRRRLGLWFGVPAGFAAAELNTGLIFLALSLNLSFCNNMAANYFNATKRPAVANMIAVCRLLIFMTGPAYALAGKLSVAAVWLSLLLAELLTIAVLTLTAAALRARDGALSPFWLLDPSYAGGKNTVDFSVVNTNEAAALAAERIVDFCAASGVPEPLTLRLSLALEEMLVLINEHAFGRRREKFADVRVTAAPHSLTLRIRYGGARYDPLARTGAAGEDAVWDDGEGAAWDDGEGAGAAAGVRMIRRLGATVEYKLVFGMNNLLVVI
ncbi:MAG: ATP-binding protein, partial [Gracilibacteraceae bacterium]|nr:ATP-binding protein [Gracilibacteraceae bacterium]